MALFHGRFWVPLPETAGPTPDLWPSVDIIIPARNEASALPHCLPSLLVQDYPGSWRVLLVDDNSTDKTGAIAMGLAAKENAQNRLILIKAPERPAGWSGKVAAMQAGVAESAAEYILFTDADIFHPRDSLRNLVARAAYAHNDLTSRMVKLNCTTLPEKLLIPAFIFFFMMLYPFRRANDADSKVAAAAGGVMLLRRRALDNIGGLTAIKSALIDDCSLARAIKQSGGNDSTAGKIEITLSTTIRSLRRYSTVQSIWNMVARTAFTQLKHSIPLLILSTLGMFFMFVVPPVLPVIGNMATIGFGFFTWGLMAGLYIPTLRLYRLPAYWAIMLPAVAVVYLLATIDSARLYWQGKGGQWKGRSQAEK